MVQVLHIRENLASIAAKIITIPYTANISNLVDVPSVESLDIQVTGVGKEIKYNQDRLDKEKGRIGKVIMTMEEAKRKRSEKSTN